MLNGSTSTVALGPLCPAFGVSVRCCERVKTDRRAARKRWVPNTPEHYPTARRWRAELIANLPTAKCRLLDAVECVALLAVQDCVDTRDLVFVLDPETDGLLDGEPEQERHHE